MYVEYWMLDICIYLMIHRQKVKRHRVKRHGSNDKGSNDKGSKVRQRVKRQKFKMIKIFFDLNHRKLATLLSILYMDIIDHRQNVTYLWKMLLGNMLPCKMLLGKMLQSKMLLGKMLLGKM